MEEEKKVEKRKTGLARLIVLVLVVGTVFCLYNYTNVLSKIFHKKYDITFVVDGKEYVQKMEYDMMAFFDGTPEKAPTKTIEYVFDKWEPELQKVEKDATYTAVFKEIERLYTVSINSNYENGATYSGVGKLYPYQESATVSVSVNNGYIFKGWYDGDECISTNSSITIDSIEEDVVLEPRFETIKKTITYNNLKGAVNSNPNEYDVTFGEFELERLKVDGFYFVGWFTGENGTGTKVETIDSSELENYTLYAHWSLVAPIYLNVDGQKVHSIDSYIGEEITLNKITSNFSPDNFGMSGYFVQKWYVDEGLTTEYSFGNELEDELTLYGTYEYFMNEIHFYPYLNEFGSACNSLSTINIGSRAKLLAWIDYVIFYDVSKSIGLKLQYCSTGAQAILDEISDAYDELTGSGTYASRGALTSYSKNLEFGLKAVGSTGYFYITKSGVSSEATLVADESKEDIYEQQDYAVMFENENKRANDFDDFNINNVSKTIPVSTSDQLVHVLMNGYKPAPVSGSKAEIVYNKAKDVLLEICNDDMTDFEKLRAIYEWLVMNVEYDNKALELSESGLTSAELTKYDAWFAEGVFNNGVAVCEGYAKAFLILSKIENIPTIIVSGDSHAWNKVLYNGEWFGIDATHGNPAVKETSTTYYEVFTYTQFFFTDVYKTVCGYTADNYLEYVAETEDAFNVYDLMEFTYQASTFDLYIDSVNELALVLKYANDKAEDMQSETTYITFEVAIDSDYEYAAFNVILGQACTESGVDAVCWFDDFDSFGNLVYSIKLSA